MTTTMTTTTVDTTARYSTKPETIPAGYKLAKWGDGSWTFEAIKARAVVVAKPKATGKVRIPAGMTAEQYRERLISEIEDKQLLLEEIDIEIRARQIETLVAEQRAMLAARQAKRRA